MKRERLRHYSKKNVTQPPDIASINPPPVPWTVRKSLWFRAPAICYLLRMLPGLFLGAKIVPAQHKVTINNTHSQPRATLVPSKTPSSAFYQPGESYAPLVAIIMLYDQQCSVVVQSLILIVVQLANFVGYYVWYPLQQGVGCTKLVKYRLSKGCATTA